MKQNSGINLENNSLRKLSTGKEFLLNGSPYKRRLVEEKSGEVKKGFSRIEVLHGQKWIPGYISHLFLGMKLPLSYV